MKIYPYIPALFFAAYVGGIGAAPVMGNLIATEHQRCGRTIEIQIADPGKSHPEQLLLGLMNKLTGEIDLFLSADKPGINRHYGTYQPVIYDALSGTFLQVNNGRPNIIWGSSQNLLHVKQFKLALGSHVYSCASPEAWPDERANELYGEEG